MAAYHGRCPGCGQAVAVDAAECRACGTELADDVVLLEPDSASGAAERTTVVELGRSRSRWRRDALIAGLMVVGLAGTLLAFRSSGDPSQSGELTPPHQEVTQTTSTSLAKAASGMTKPPDAGPLLGQTTGFWVTTRGRLSMNATNVDTGGAIVLSTSAAYERGVVARQGGVVVVDTEAHAWTKPFDQPPITLGTARWALAAAAPDQVWLGSDDERTTVRLVALDGRELFGPYDLPEGAHPVAGVDGGLLVSAVGGIYRLETSDQRFQQVASGQALAAVGSTVASYDCNARLECGVKLTDLGRGETRDLQPPHGYGFRSWATASFSPDGSRLSVAVATEGDVKGTALAIYDVDSGTSEVVDGTQLVAPSPFPVIHTWAPDGNWLFWCTDRVRAYHVASHTTFDLSRVVTPCAPDMVVF